MQIRRTHSGWIGVGLITLMALLLGFLLMTALSRQVDAGYSRAAPNLTVTDTPVFTATVDVLPSATLITVGEGITVNIAIRTSVGCRFAVYESTLLQSGDGAFAYVDPPTHTVGPPGNHRYQLSALTPGEVVFHAELYGERYCDDYWAWRYLFGVSESVVVTEVNLSERLYLPTVRGQP